jgi:hypothetical protein
MLVLATTACSVNAGGRPDGTRRPRPSPTGLVPSTRTSPAPSASPQLTTIPVRSALAYSGAASAAQPPVKLGGGTYQADWSATGVKGRCLFRARLDPLDGGTAYLIPEGQAPMGMTVQGGAHLEIPPGAYEVQVIARSCRWRLNVSPLDHPTG